MKIVYRGNADERSFTEADFARHDVKGGKDLTFKGFGDVQEVTKEVFEFLQEQGEPFMEEGESNKADEEKAAADAAAAEAELSATEQLARQAQEAGVDVSVVKS